eukprot:6745498-Prymnesium_polylepis.1
MSAPSGTPSRPCTRTSSSWNRRPVSRRSRAWAGCRCCSSRLPRARASWCPTALARWSRPRPWRHRHRRRSRVHLQLRNARAAARALADRMRRQPRAPGSSVTSRFLLQARVCRVALSDGSVLAAAGWGLGPPAYSTCQHVQCGCVPGREVRSASGR